MNVYDYIKNYAAFHGIKEYNLKCRYVTKAQAAETLQFSGGVAFFYRIIAEGEIADRSQLTRKFLEVDTPTDFWDLSPVVEVVDFGTLQKVQTDFIFSDITTGREDVVQDFAQFIIFLFFSHLTEDVS